MKPVEMSPADLALIGQSLRNVNLFSDISKRDLKSVLERVRLFRVPPGHVVFRQGDPGDALYVVSEGRLRVVVKPGWFRFLRVTGELSQGMYFGETSLLDGAPRAATVETVTEAKIFVLLREDFERVAGSSPDFQAHIRRVADQQKSENRKAA